MVYGEQSIRRLVYLVICISLNAMKRARKDNPQVPLDLPIFPPVPVWALEDEHEPQNFQEFVEMERWEVYEINCSFLSF
jgi:hypothetical protein